MSSVDASILFQVAARGVGRRALRQFTHTLESKVANGRQFTCLITDDEELRRLNRQFRNQDHATDVLSFRGAGISACNSLGDIAISFDRAKQQARELGHNIQQELQILILHGLLHLTGMDHERDRGRMARAEKRWRRRLGLPAGLIERVRP